MAPLNDPRPRTDRPAFGGGLTPAGANPPNAGGGDPPDDGSRAFEAELLHADQQSRAALNGVWIMVGVVCVIVFGYTAAVTFLQPG